MNPSSPTLRGEPKIHKPDILIRPEVNYRVTPPYTLGKHIATSVNQTVNLHNTYTILNTE